ncbi:hypothetical protein BV25DRAFT_1873269 [Artomyces pyxidatus]|uniref:Uncharacterized protein n=1 Tax=Artomyces pyxidatus TaxID=48021 RepID=A0ACB8SGB2_9AGAM|nr:hypothetical protein BV25DRAFT_1873269 [Artomyces pyxidatus]
MYLDASSTRSTASSARPTLTSKRVLEEAIGGVDGHGFGPAKHPKLGEGPGDAEGSDNTGALSLDAAHEDPNIPDPGSISETAAREALESPEGPENPTPQRGGLQNGTTLLDRTALRPTADDIPSVIEDIEVARTFIKLLENASLDDNKLNPDTLERLRNPPHSPPDLDNPDLRLALDIFLSVSNASQETYNSVRAGIKRRYPDSKMLSFDQIKKKVAELSGVCPIVDDMCINACLAYIGPFSHLETCPTCNEPRWDPLKLVSSRGRSKVPRQTFHTIPVGPQLQARRRTPEMAALMRHRVLKTEKMFLDFEDLGKIEVEVYEDVYHGRDLINAVRNGIITSDDTVLMLSIDGAQLYQHKTSDVWIYIWVILDLAPDLRYKKAHILPGGFIPGKPKVLDSFFFRGAQHVVALGKEGVKTWDASQNKMIIDRPFVAFGAADTPAMALLDGMVGHSGRFGCHFYCEMQGRHKPNAPHYYPARLKPHNYVMPGSDHDDVSLRSLIAVSSEATAQRYEANLAIVIRSSGPTQYRKNRLETGICKPSIFSGIPRFLGVPAGFPADLMHLASLNLTDLLISLWRGTIDCDRRDDKSTWEWAVLHGETWKTHGRNVAAATPYLPGSFDQFLLYIYGLGPALLYGVLPDPYWRNYCKLVFGIRVLHQFVITLAELRRAQKALIEFSEEFELLYYQRKVEHLHFCRQSVHQAPHLAPETIRMGPLGLVSQWAMECTIGNLGEEVKQPSNWAANLSQRGARAVALGANYILLRAMDTAARLLRPREARGASVQVTGQWHRNPVVTRWVRLRLPNGQVARSAWKELQKPLENVRMARNVKLRVNGAIRFGEVQFYCRLRIPTNHSLDGDLEDLDASNVVEDSDGAAVDTIAVVALYGLPDEDLLQASCDTVWLAPYLGDEGLVVVSTNSILSVVAMVPWENIGGLEHANGYIEGQRYFVVEKPGLDIIYKGVGEDVEGG